MASSPRPRRSRALLVFRIFLVAVFGLALWGYFNIHTVVIRGNSMEPTFRPGNRLVVTNAYWLFGPVRRNDIVVVKEFTRRGGFFIKRVVGTAGDSIENVYWPLNVPIESPDFKVPPNQVFLLGDNRSQSEDSRSFGPISKDLIIGKVLVLR